MLFTDIFRLLPGFRFRPTDEELVSFYLKRKVGGGLLPFEVIAEIDLYKYEPWDLPEKSALPSRDLEWYFFIPRDRKFPNGSRTNRATAKGYWKSTGKDRLISSGSRAVGTKKTLVYYNGRTAKGARTNWVIHEYRLNDAECQRIHAAENGFVLCRVYQKSGPGPKNGEQYGAPVEDEDFEDSPTIDMGGSRLLKSDLIEIVPSSAHNCFGESYTPCGEKDGVSFGFDGHLPCTDFEPRNLTAHFKHSCGKFQETSMQNFACSTVGDFMCSANGKLAEPAIVTPVTSEEEAEMLEQILGECAGELNSTNGYQDGPTLVEYGYNQAGAHFPNDGDFLELNDLVFGSDSEEGNVLVKDNEKKVSIGGKDYTSESQCSSMQGLPTFDASGQWQNMPFLPFGDRGCEGQVTQEQAMTTYDSQMQPCRKNMLGSFPLPPGSAAAHNKELGSASQTGSAAAKENLLKLLSHLNECVNEEDIFRELLESEQNSSFLLQDGSYYDAVPSFTDMDACGESANTNLQAIYDDSIRQMGLPQSSLTSKVDEALEKPEHFERVSQAEDLVLEDVSLSQAEPDGLEQGIRSPRSFGLFLKWIDSLPTLPASAAELSPKGTSPGRSIRVTATGIGVNAVSVTCSCMGEGVPSCVNCSVAEVENKGRVLKSMSFVGQRKKSLIRWDMGLFVSAVFGGLLALFVGVLIATGAWKLLGGIC